MKASSRFLGLIVVGAALALGACGGSPEASPAASTTAIVSDGGFVTSAGNGPGAPPSVTPGSGTCTHECDGTGQGPGGGLCGGACSGPVGPDPADIAAVLEIALQEEYKAQMLYRSVLGTFGPETRPFALIAESEARHVEALQTLFTRRQLAPPASAWTPGSFDPFASLALACAAGVAAEREDAELYTPYLQRSDLPPDVRTVFTNLQAASLESHLPAFTRCQ